MRCVIYESDAYPMGYHLMSSPEFSRWFEGYLISHIGSLAMSSMSILADSSVA